MDSSEVQIHKMFRDIYMILSSMVVARILKNVDARDSQITSFNFTKDLVGVFFAPYTKFHSDKYDYTIEEVETMLEIIAERFKMVSTFNMGASAVRNDTEGTGLVPVAAGRLNKKLGRLAITVNIGIYQSALLLDLKSGFHATKEANELFPGTVTGMIITSFNTYTAGQREEIVNLVKNNKIELQAHNLIIGTRTSNCKELLDLAANNDATTLELIQTLDEIICHVDPVIDAVTVTTPFKAAEWFGMNLKTWEAGLRKFNPRFRLVAESGWPSKEQGKNGVDGSIKNMEEYWFAMDSFCKKNGIRADMWQAFDEPWKIEFAPFEPHFGWWTRVKRDSVLSTDRSAFAEKINYVEPFTVTVNWLLLGSIIAGIAIIGTILGVAYLVIRLKRIESQLLTNKDIDEFENGILEGGGEDGAEDALLLPYDRSYEILKSHFLIDRSKLLGRGAFGVVYKGKLENNADNVAFKMTQNNCSANNLKSLLSEIKIMIHVGKHENVVSIIGAYTAELRTGHVMIATELCDMGSLETYLRSFKSTYINLAAAADGEAPQYANCPLEDEAGFNVNNFVRWSYEIACGMEHICSKNVIHADLATRNVLLTRNKTAKITDFGLSRRLYEYTNYVKSNQEPLPWRWMAFESLTQMTFSTKSDVWAFGVTLWEILSFGDVPFPGLSWSLEFTDMLEKGLRMNKPGQASNEMYQVMTDCWDLNPASRPNFTTLKECIGKYL